VPGEQFCQTPYFFFFFCKKKVFHFPSEHENENPPDTVIAQTPARKMESTMENVNTSFPGHRRQHVMCDVILPLQSTFFLVVWSNNSFFKFVFVLYLCSSFPSWALNKEEEEEKEKTFLCL
jgi:hypothetical protein